MKLIYFSIVFIIIGMITLIIGSALKKNKIQIIGAGFVIITLLFWIGFSIWAIYNEDLELKNQIGSEIENKVVQENCIFENNVSSNNIYNENNNSINIEDISSKSYIDITHKFENGKFYRSGQIYMIEDELIKFVSEDKYNYGLLNLQNTIYIDGRTGENISFEDIKVGYYISLSYDYKCYIYKNIQGEELKKELLISMSLPNNIDLVRAWPEKIKYVQELGNNEAIITCNIMDVVTEDTFPINKTQEFDIQFKVNKSTKYNSNVSWGPTTYPEAIENAKNDAILSIRLDPETLDDKYPVIIQLDSHSD